MTRKVAPKSERVATLLFPLLALALFPEVIAGKTFFHYDTWMQNLAFRSWWFEMLRQGHFATWCSGMFAGYPLFAETQTGPLYPPTFVLFSILPATLAFSWSVVLHFAFAGAGMFLAARRFGMGWGGALYAGVAFELSGVLVTHVVHYNLLVGAAWMPWVARFALGAAERRSASLVALPASIAMLLLGAHPYATLMNGAVATAVVLARSGRRPRAVLSGTVMLAALLALAVVVAAVQLLPAREFLERTTRGNAVDWSFLTFGSFPPWNVFTLASPDLYGTPVTDTYWAGPDWSHFSETCAYAGWLTLALATVAVVIRRDRATALFVVVAAVSGLLMLGRFTPVYRILASLPVLEATRLPGRFALPATFAITMLAGLGLDALPHVKGPRRVAALTVSVLVVLALGAGAWHESAAARAPDPELASTGQAWPERLERIHGDAHESSIRLGIVGLGTLVFLGTALGRVRVRSAWTTGIAVAWTAGELFTWGRTFNPMIEREAVSSPPPVVNALRRALPEREPRPRVFRQGVDEVWSRGAGMPRTDLMTPGWKGRESEYRSGAWTLPPNTQLLYGIDSGEGFTSLLPRAWLEWVGLGDRPGAAPRADLTEAQADLLSIDAVISTGSGIRGEGWEATALPGDVWWSRNRNPLPRARLARSWTTIAGRAELLERLGADGYDPRRAVLLEAPPPGLPPSRTDGPVDQALPARETAPGQWEIDVPGGADAIVVLSETFDPDWIAEDEAGASLPVFRADGLFVAVATPGGEGTVRLEHAPASVRTGAAVSVLGLLLLTGWFVFARRLSPRSGDALQVPVSPWVTWVTVLAFATCLAFSATADVGGWKASRMKTTLDAAAVRVWTGEAQVALRAGAVEAARTLLQTAAQRTPHDATVHYRLGLVHRQSGDKASAVRSFERALREDPGFELARIALREMEQVPG